MMLTGLADVLRSAGLTVVELPGWKTRGHGPMIDVRGVTCHHTAGGRSTKAKLSLPVVLHGRPGLDGPLANLYLDRDGTYYVVAAGLCYHAGVSNATDRTNGHRIGIEGEAAGDGWSQDWPVVQMAAYHLGCKALAEHYGFDVAEVLGHKETCSPYGRKIDPSFNMDTFRDGVHHATTTPQEADMRLTDTITLTAAMAKAMTAAGVPKKEGDTISVGWALTWGGPRDSQLYTALQASAQREAAMAAQLTALTAAVNAIAQGSSAGVAAAFSAGITQLKTELANLDVRVVLDDNTKE